MLKKMLLSIFFFLLPLGALGADLDIRITKNRLAWNQWQFGSLDTSPDYLFLWDFGDGSLAETRDPAHSFKKSGAYKITLSVSDGLGQIGRAETTVQVGFWSLYNRKLQILLLFLALGTVTFSLSLIFGIKLPFKLIKD